ncbi:protein SEH1-like isoform X2 [Rhododendron vialii]|uniref:protein SEH1-like isoform X2 n=1 Tax=Rhododendron vialii TaxID=182163 RepID=UPI00265DC9A5|nr:protein SEH1-like isoform X2 [Rhododendron vialii]
MTLITIGTHKQIALWHLGLNPNIDGKLSTEKGRMCFLNLPLQILYFRDQVWEMEWNISGMTLATTGGDGVACMDDYGGIERCVFTVNSISDPINIEEPLQLEAPQPQPAQP